MLIGIDANEANLTTHRVGVNQYAFNLLHALYNLKTPHEFVIYLKTPVLPDLPLPRMGWSYRVIPFPKLWTQTRLPFDLFLHSPRPQVFFSMTHYAPRFCPVPSVVAIMDLGFLKFPKQFTSKDFNQLRSWTAYSVKKAKKVMAISQFTKQDITSAYSYPADKIAVTYLGYDTELYKPATNPKVLEKYAIRKPYFLFMSSLKPSKNIENLIRAFADFPDKTYSLIIAGKKAWLFDQIFALVKNFKLEDRVIFTGFVDESEKPVLMTSASAFVMPSFYEGFGIPVVEAMACGTPVVVSSVASLPEVAGDAGIYVDPYDVASITAALSVAISSKSKTLTKIGLNRVKLFSWVNCAKQTLKELENV